jgi:hypothetical protein
MTLEFGAASRREKIDRIDFTDVVARVDECCGSGTGCYDDDELDGVIRPKLESDEIFA